MTHRMKLQPRAFNLIVTGRKTIELRLYDEKRKKIAVGDTIIFSNTENSSEQFSALVKNLYIFASFKELYQALPLNKCGYSQSEILQASPNDMTTFYSLSQQKQYGVIGIEIESTKA